MNLEMSEYAVVGKRYTLVLPKAIRRKLQIEEGQ
jgi:bifunctional DNA-binding transcriptional regulator/antitoxin component of YhaV-PrlF toxin-antitoxin module